MQGSARQLFQRLQEPMEEDTLKSHFEKIIKIGQKHHYRKSQVCENKNRFVQSVQILLEWVELEWFDLDRYCELRSMSL